MTCKKEGWDSEVTKAKASHHLAMPMSRICDRGQPWWTVFTMDEHTNNRTHLNFRLFLPITPLQVLLSLPTWALKSPSRKMDSLHVAPLSTLHHWLQEGWVFWPVTWQIIADNSQDLFPKLKAQGNTPLTHWQKLQCTEQIKDCPPCSLPLTEGNSRLEQRRSPLQETGSRAQASSGSFPFREVIFHVPKATLDSRKSVCQGRFFGLRLGTSRSLWMGPW